MSTVLARYELRLPWESSDLEDRRFKTILRNFLSSLLAFGIVMPLVPVPEIERHEQETLPPRLAQIVLEQKLLARIRMIMFGSKSVMSTTLNYSFDFLPY